MRKVFVQLTKDEKGEYHYPPKQQNWFLLQVHSGGVKITPQTEPPKAFKPDHPNKGQALLHLAELHPPAAGWISFSEDW
jgi:hypothetical protein